MENDKAIFKWVIPNYGDDSFTDRYIKSKKFTMTKNKNITWSLHLFKDYCANCNLVGFYVCCEDIQEKYPIKLIMSWSTLDSSNEKLFTERKKVRSDQIEELYSIGIMEHDFLINNRVNNDLVLLFEIETRFDVNLKISPLSENQLNFITDQAFSDVCLYIGNKSIDAHRAILVSKSKVFCEKFSMELEESSITCEAEIMDIGYEIFVEMLRFIYTGRVRKLNEMALDLLMAAHAYEVNDLFTICENVLSKNINFENAIAILKAADASKAQNLKNNCLTFIHQNFTKFQFSSELEKLTEIQSHLLIDIIHVLKVADF